MRGRQVPGRLVLAAWGARESLMSSLEQGELFWKL